MAKDAIHDINATTDYTADKGHAEVDELRRQVKELTDKYGSMAQNTLSDVKDRVQQNWAISSSRSATSPFRRPWSRQEVGFLVGAL